MSTLALSVAPFKPKDEATIDVLASTIAGKSGYIKVTLNQISVNLVDTPPVLLPFGKPPDLGPGGDGTPQFAAGPCKSLNPLVNHALAKRTGVSTYKKAAWVFAVNNGLVDGFGSNVARATGDAAELFRVALARLPERPTDDGATLTLDYTLTTSVNTY